jgi:hypothetical protein
MSVLTEPENPDDLLDAAWLAQASKAANAAAEIRGEIARAEPFKTHNDSSAPPKPGLPRTDQTPEEGGGTASTISLEKTNYLPRQHNQLSRRSSPLRRPVLIGCISVMALIAIPFAFFERWRQPINELAASEPPTVMQNEVGTSKLIVEPSLGIAGEPVQIGLSLRGQVNDAIVVISGLVPGMELSAGSALARTAWQLPASDLPYAWVAPPQDFVGSAALVAELRLPNGQIADRQALLVEWMRPAPVGHTLGQRSETAPASAPETVQHPNDRILLTAPSSISIGPSQGKVRGEYGQDARARNRNNLRPGTHGINVERNSRVKGFWDWSR